MTGRSDLHSSHFFTKIIAGAFSEALEQTTKIPWSVQEVEKPEMSQSQGPAQLYRISLEGSLRGECFLEFLGREVADLGTRMAGNEGMQSAAGVSGAFLKFLRAVAQVVETQLSASYGESTVGVQSASEVAASVTKIAPLLATDSASGRLAVLLYFNQKLIDSMNSKSTETNSNVDHSSTETIQNMANEANLNLIMDVELNLTLRFGQRKLPLRDVMELNGGSVIELDRQVDEPVELLLGDKVIARGEAVIVDGNYGLRITEVPQPISTQLRP